MKKKGAMYPLLAPFELNTKDKILKCLSVAKIACKDIIHVAR